MPNIVTVTANRERLIPDVINAGTRGSFGTTRLAFQFSDYWDGMTISVVFYPIRGNPVRVPYLPGNIIDVPDEVMLYNGEAQYVVSGVLLSDDELIEKNITLTGRIRVAYTANGAAGNARKITPDVYDLFLSQAKDYINRHIGGGGESGEGTEEGSGNAGFVIVTTLPNNPDENVLYLVSGESGYTAYVYNGGNWNQIGASNELVVPDVAVERTTEGVRITVDSGSGVTTATVHDGANFAIKGYYDTFAGLSAAVPNPTAGDVYGVGEEEPYDLYVWDSVGEMWRNNGSIAGVPGADGQDGISPTITASKSNGVTTLTITDKNGTRTATINDGQNGSPGTNGTNGSPGSTPVKGTDYWTAADKAEIVQDVLNALPAWQGGDY